MRKKVAGITDWKKKTEKGILGIQKSIDALNKNFVSEKDFKNFVIYKGQKFEADVAYIFSLLPNHEKSAKMKV